MEKQEWDEFYRQKELLSKQSLCRHKTAFKAYFDAIRKNTKKNAFILEIACGPGKLLTILSRMRDYKIIATDLNKSLLSAATANVRAFGKKENVSFAVLDAFNLPKDKRFQGKRFDAIVHHGFIEHFKEKEMLELLKIQQQACGRIVFGLPYYTKRNRQIWKREKQKIYRSKWKYLKWKKFLSKNFPDSKVSHFNDWSDNLLCVISGKKQKAV